MTSFLLDAEQEQEMVHGSNAQVHIFRELVQLTAALDDVSKALVDSNRAW